MKLSIIFFFVANFLFAQKADLTGSIIAFNKEDIETAKELIDIAHDKYMKKLVTVLIKINLRLCQNFGTTEVKFI